MHIFWYYYGLLDCAHLYMGPELDRSYRYRVQFSCTDLPLFHRTGGQQCLQFLRNIPQLTLPHASEDHRRGLHKNIRVDNDDGLLTDHQCLRQQ